MAALYRGVQRAAPAARRRSDRRRSPSLAARTPVSPPGLHLVLVDADPRTGMDVEQIAARIFFARARSSPHIYGHQWTCSRCEMLAAKTA
jgi:hypothetical protein